MVGHYVGHVTDLGRQHRLLTDNLLSVRFASSPISLGFILTHLNPPVGINCDIAHSYKLFAFTILDKIVGTFSYVFFKVLKNFHNQELTYKTLPLR